MSKPTHYADRLGDAIKKCGTPAVVGIDPIYERLPDDLRPPSPTLRDAIVALESFGCGVIDAVAGIVPAVKINSGFFEAYHEWGVSAYYELIAYAHRRGLLVLGDVKRGDIGSTARLYAAGHVAKPAFAELPDERVPDAVTVAGYLGENAVHAFADEAAANGRGLYVLVRPSDPGADRLHDFGVSTRFYQHLAELVHAWGQDDALHGACGLSCVGAVVAAKDAESTVALRKAMPHTPWLVPGYGAQGGTAEDCRPCFTRQAGSAVINASRSVIYAYEREQIRAEAGDSWQACVQLAAEQFARDVAPLLNDPAAV